MTSASHGASESIVYAAFTTPVPVIESFPTTVFVLASESLSYDQETLPDEQGSSPPSVFIVSAKAGTGTKIKEIKMISALKTIQGLCPM